jgi:hypothetical protein
MKGTTKSSQNNFVLTIGDEAFGWGKGSKIEKMIDFCGNLPHKNKSRNKLKI